MQRDNSNKINLSAAQNYLKQPPQLGIKEFPLIGISNIIDVLHDFTGYVSYLNKFLDFDLVFSECKKHKIRTISFDFKAYSKRSFLRANKKCEESWGSLITDSHRVDGCIYIIYLNPFLDRVSVANKLSEILKITISSEEIYYPIFFHEVGHIVNKHKNIGLLYRLNQCSKDEFIRIYSKQEKEAWGYAKNRFIEHSQELICNLQKNYLSI